MSFYVGAEPLFHKEGHPYCEDKTNQMNLIYQGYGAFKQDVTTDVVKLINSKDIVLGYTSVKGYEFGLKEWDNFTPVECSTIDEAKALVHRVVEPWYTDRHHPILLYIGEIYAFTYDEFGNHHKEATLREWSM